jgi:NAD(P)-dependent dehydrogenase (short-subunit alcohol dehydrogenase family)
MQVNLIDKVAVVTGGGGVLCSAFAKALAKNGAKVAVLDLNQEAADKVAAAIANEGGQAIGVKANVLDLANLQQAKKIVNQQLGSCDLLINGAGGNHPKGTTSNEQLVPEDLTNKELTTFFDLDPVGIKFVFDLNFLGTLLPTQVFAKDMVEKTMGNIINISSMNAFTPLTKIPAYSAAKAAVSNFTQWLAVHMAKMNIRVNAIAPGFFLTAQNQSLLQTPDGNFTARAKKILSQTPMGRLGDPQELIGALLWLADNDSSSFVTGTIIPVDGGFSAYSGV